MIFKVCFLSLTGLAGLQSLRSDEILEVDWEGCCGLLQTITPFSRVITPVFIFGHLYRWLMSPFITIGSGPTVEEINLFSRK